MTVGCCAVPELPCIVRTCASDEITGENEAGMGIKGGNMGGVGTDHQCRRGGIGGAADTQLAHIIRPPTIHVGVELDAKRGMISCCKVQQGVYIDLQYESY
jgi:hypothetical protein